MNDAWEAVFAPEPVPEWLLAFESAPVEALDSLLGRRFYFGPLNAADPEELLVDWALLLAGANGFVVQLDEALAAWIEANWGIFPQERSAARMADAWSRLTNVVTYVEDLPRAAQALRSHFEDRDDFLGPLSVSPSRDPLGRYLMAVAEHQEDRHLAPFWWSLCDLQDGVPFHRAPCAIAGLLGLPPLDETQAGGFREQAAWGVVRLAEALHRRIERRELQSTRARDEWLWTARRAMARLPFPASWQEIFEEAIRRGIPAECQAWLEIVAPSLTSELGNLSSRHRPRETFDIHSWPKRAQSIARALRENQPQALEQARVLLREEEHYALLYGDSGNLVRSLRNFTSSVWRRVPERALQWAEMAVSWEPWDAYSWNILTQARWKARGAEAGLSLAWEAVERFPENSVARNGLAEILKSVGHLAEAEAVYRQAMTELPTNDVTRNGLAGLLKEVGRLAEAESVYRQTMRDFPSNTYARNGLAEILKEAGRLDEAELVYRQTIAELPTNVVTLNGLAGLLKEIGRLDKAESVYRQAMMDFPSNAYARNGLAEILKEAGRLDEAESVYRQTMAELPTNAVTLNGLAEVLKEAGHLAEAESVYRQTITDFPTSVVARTGLAEVLKEAGHTAEAETVYRQAMVDFPTNTFAPVGLAALLRLRGPAGWEEAMALVERIYRSGQNRAAALAEKGRLLERMGRREEAAETFEMSRSLELPPVLPLVIEAENKPVQASEPQRRTFLSRSQRAAWTSEARFLRRWARSGGDPDQGRPAGVLRQQAEGLLKEILRLRPADARALTEMALLLLDGGRLPEARDLLAGVAERLPGTPAPLVALARLEREQARAESLRLSEKSLAKVFDASDRLRALGGGFEPLIHLQKGRAVLALQDGQLRRNLASRELDKLHQWTRPHLKPELKTFEAWWSRRLNEQVFLPIQPDATVGPEDIESLSIRLDARTAEIDALDEAFGLRKAPRAAPVA
ncbi:MAG: tetratricopeptide repeat protein [Thermoanaerobaculia bacterium]